MTSFKSGLVINGCWFQIMHFYLQNMTVVSAAMETCLPLFAKKVNFPGVIIGFYMLCWTSQCFCAGFSTHKLNILCLAARTLLCSEVFASPKVAAFLCKRLVCTAHHHCIE